MMYCILAVVSKKNTSHSVMNNVVSSQFFLMKKKLKTPHYPPLSPSDEPFANEKKRNLFPQFCHNFIFINSKWLIRAAETTPKRKLLLKKLSKKTISIICYLLFFPNINNIIIQKEIRCKIKKTSKVLKEKIKNFWTTGWPLLQLPPFHLIL